MPVAALVVDVDGAVVDGALVAVVVDDPAVEADEDDEVADDGEDDEAEEDDEDDEADEAEEDDEEGTGEGGVRRSRTITVVTAAMRATARTAATMMSANLVRPGPEVGAAADGGGPGTPAYGWGGYGVPG